MTALLPEKIESVWMATTGDTNFPNLQVNLETDVVIIGGGMAGLNDSYFLKNQGLKVTLIEAGKIAGGTSGNTTAKVTSLHGLRYKYLTDTFGKEGAQIYANSNEWAISELENIIKKENINCDFYKAPSYTYTKIKNTLEEIKQEVEVSLSLNLPASFVTSIPTVPLKISGAVKFKNQAYFHPRKYLMAIAGLINSGGSYIFENTRALDIQEGKDFCEVKTSKSILRSKFVIVATNLPFYDPNKTFSQLSLIGSFVIAATPKSKAPKVMFIGTESFDLSFRPHKDRKREWLIIGARHQDRDMGETAEQHFSRLVKLAEENFKIKSIDYKWGAADTMSLDKVPYIGKMPGFARILVTTGFSAWGMTTSMFSAKLLTDLILGKKNSWQSLYDPKRILK